MDTSGNINILAICGSTRKSSSNLNLIAAISTLAKDVFTLTLFDGLTALSHFNPDDDGICTPAPVAAFRHQLRAADGVLICTPEYAIGVPGTLKNAIDWTVSSMEFSGKPVALITAGSSGEKGHRSLKETLTVIEAQTTVDMQLIIPFVKTKVNDTGEIIHPETLVAVKRLIAALAATVRKSKTASAEEGA